MTAAPAVTPLVDQHGRHKHRLRVSLTDRCNFRCPYCLPDTPDWLPRSHWLGEEPRLRLLRCFVERLGIRRIRLTGGEPLLSPALMPTLLGLQPLRAAGLERISLTTNGSLLAGRADALRDAGLDDINISLDAIDPAVFRDLSGGRPIEPVIRGIEAAVRAGLPVKLNAVIIRDRNDSQIRPLADWARDRSLPLRFIEYMPLDCGRGWRRHRVVTEAEILSELGIAEPARSADGADPASYYRRDGHRVGVIPTVSRPFCGRCDRLRLTVTGQLLPCLFSTEGPSLGALLDDEPALLGTIRRAVHGKSAGHAAPRGYVERPVSMHGIGG